MIAGVAGNDTISLGEGESAKATYTQIVGTNNGPVPIRVTIADKVLDFSIITESGFHISGPATIKLLDNNPQPGLTRLATFAVTRVGQFTEPACIPIEAGSTFSVILESSADLVNWTPANPGSYPGTDTKRFFRTRIVRQ